MSCHRAVIGPLVAGLLVVPVFAIGATSPSRGAAGKTTSRAPAAVQVLPWVEDDYTRAVAEAKARKLPIFVESWAPW